jgi:outer membrane protein OmpU
LSQTLDNGLTATAVFDFDVADNNNGQDLTSGGYLLSLTSDTAGMYFGDTAFAAETAWASAGDMESDGFSEADGEVVLRGEVTMAGVTANLSYAIANVDGDIVANDTDDSVDQLSVGLTGTFGNFTVSAAYQDEATYGAYFAGNGDFNAAEIIGLSGSTTFSGATVTVAYASNLTADTSSTGVKVAYPFGPVTATAYYVMEDSDAGDVDDNFGINLAYEAGAVAVTLDYQDDQGVSKTAIDGSYDLGNGLEIFAGMYMEDDIENEFYVAGSYDLGGGASVLVAYADAQDDTDDEVGANEYQRGTTVEVSFTF